MRSPEIIHPPQSYIWAHKLGQSRGTAEQWAQLPKGVGKWKILQCNLVLKERSPLWDSEVEEKLAPFEELWNGLLSRSQRKSNEEESGRRYSHLKKPYVSSFSHWETMEKQNKKKLEFMIFDLFFPYFLSNQTGHICCLPFQLVLVGVKLMINTKFSD